MRSSSTSTRRRTRPRASARAPTGRRAHDLLDGAPLAELREADGVREPRPRARRSPSSPAPRCELVAARRRRALPRRRARGSGTDRSTTSSSSTARRRSAPLTVNALAAADRVLVPGAGRVLRARGAVAAARLDRPRQGAGSTRASRVGGDPADDGRRRARGSRPDVEAELRRHFGELVFTDVGAALGAPRRGAEPRPARDRLRPPLGRRRRRTGRWRWSLSSASDTPRRGLGRGLEVLIGGAGEARAAAPARSRRSTRTRASRGGASTPRRPRASRTRSATRASSSRSSCARAPRAATS